MPDTISHKKYRKVLSTSCRETGTLIHREHDDKGVIEVIDDTLLRSMYFGTNSRQSCMLHVNPNFLALLYTQAMMVSLLFIDKPESVLMIGLGGGSLAKFLLSHYPECTIDAIEYREKVAKIAHGYFKLPETPRLNIHIADAENKIKEIEKNKYDLILLDAFDKSRVSPSIAKLDFITACKDRLNNNGVFVINLWSKSEDFKRTFQTISKTFSGNALRYMVKKKGNVIVFASRQNLSTSYLKQLHTKAQALQERLEITLSEFLTRLIHQNSFLFRLLH